MKKYVKAVLVILVGLWLVNVGFQMAMPKKIMVKDTRGKHAAVGAAVGVSTGILAGLVFGGVGIATGGIAFGVGLPMMALLGAGEGAFIGAATGSKEIIQSVYSPWDWVFIIIIGLIITWKGMKMFREAKRIAHEIPKALPQ